MEEKNNRQHLRHLVEEYLRVFDEPLCQHLDIPSWVHTVSPSAASGDLFTARKLIRAMYNTAADLGLDDGERYVLSAVCSCADDAKTRSSSEAQSYALARGLARLAAFWTTNLLWPCERLSNACCKYDSMLTSRTSLLAPAGVGAVGRCRRLRRRTPQI